MQRTTIDFGIDLGTTNSTIAVIDGIDAKVIPNMRGSGITPSAVWIDPRGRLMVGQEARERALTVDQENGFVEFKGSMGLETKRRFVRAGRDMLPEELSAEVLKSLKTDVQTSMGETLRAAVITVPAAFENPQTNATQKAARLAGFVSSPLLLEPVAASLAYGFQSESENVYWMVYDFGGGTFDAAVMRIRDGLIQVVNHEGDNFLGGKSIDWDLVEQKLVPALVTSADLPDFRRGNDRWKAVFGKLKWAAEEAKIQVCRSKAPSEIWVEGLCEDASGKRVDFTYSLTPQDVQDATRPWVEKSLSLCRKTLSQAGLNGPAMDRVLMVGGTTLNPWLREMVQAELGAKLEFGVDPVTVVARGAAIFASMQPLPSDRTVQVPTGTWRIEIEHKPVGNVTDPDIGGRVIAPAGVSLAGYTIELVDLKTNWRTGRISLGADGVFLTQLFAEKQRRHEYAIELTDASGTRIPTVPDRVTYTLGVVPEENPPAVKTIGVGQADGSVAVYFKKGQKLPARKPMDHFTILPLRAGHAEDVLRIPLLEGEHLRAERNHFIGAMEVRGTDIRRDLPAGSQIEIRLDMDVSQKIRMQVYINALDHEFDPQEFDAKMEHNSLDELRATAEQQKSRLAAAHEAAERTKAAKALPALGRIADQRLVAHIDTLLGAARGDPDAVVQLDRRLRELAAEIDAVEDAAEWPTLLEQAEQSRTETEKCIEQYGQAADRKRFDQLRSELEGAIQAGDPHLLRRAGREFDGLRFEVLDRQPGFHVARFHWLVEQIATMRDRGQAEQLAARGRQAINGNDVEALKAANRQLLSLLPNDLQNQIKQHDNVGSTMTRQ